MITLIINNPRTFRTAVAVGLAVALMAPVKAKAQTLVCTNRVYLRNGTLTPSIGSRCFKLVGTISIGRFLIVETNTGQKFLVKATVQEMATARQILRSNKP